MKLSIMPLSLRFWFTMKVLLANKSLRNKDVLVTFVIGISVSMSSIALILLSGRQLM